MGTIGKPEGNQRETPSFFMAPHTRACTYGLTAAMCPTLISTRLGEPPCHDGCAHRSNCVVVQSAAGLCFRDRFWPADAKNLTPGI
jgi:hypothetical protein